MAEQLSSVVIVGGGLAGAMTAVALREQGYAGPVTLFATEDELPYRRPPMSKQYLTGDSSFDEFLVHDRAWYDEHDIALHLGTEVTAVRAASHEVELGDGSRVNYGALVLATGSEPAVPPIPGAESAYYLRTRADSDKLRDAFGPGKRVVIVGAGWIGLEAASAARGAGCEVTILESAELPLLGVVGREMAAVFADLHRDNGVNLRTGVAVTAITDAGVEVDGETLPADVVVVGTGAKPNLDLAISAGLAIDEATGGVAVDAALRTDDPVIAAVGDIASHDHPVLGGRIRVEHITMAQNQPAVAVASLLGGADTYAELPYFYSDQFDLGMEYVGHATPGSYARVIVRGDLAEREFVAFWLDDDDRILAAMNVNVWDVLDDIRPLIGDKTVVDVDKLADADVPLTAVAA